MGRCSGSQWKDGRLAIEHPFRPTLIDSGRALRPTLIAPEPRLLILGSQSCLAGSDYCNGLGACQATVLGRAAGKGGGHDRRSRGQPFSFLVRLCNETGGGLLTQG